MDTVRTKILVDFEQPILFRTTNIDVYKATLTTGSLWLRSDQYFRQIEDAARKDEFEGVNAGKFAIPLRFKPENGSAIEIRGSGYIGQQIVPHYILSLHGNSISKAQLCSFGNCTFGIKNLSRLSAEILYRSSLVIACKGYRFGAVYYQFAALGLSHSQHGGSSAMCIGGAPPAYLNPLNTDVLRKRPVMPFMEQDEWRIVIFTDAYLNDDPTAPLKINVDPSHFYAYPQD